MLIKPIFKVSNYYAKNKADYNQKQIFKNWNDAKALDVINLEVGNKVDAIKKQNLKKKVIV